MAVVTRLPKTRSGKILRGTMKKLADGSEFKVPATIDDPMILEEIAESLKALGYAGGGCSTCMIAPIAAVEQGGELRIGPLHAAGCAALTAGWDHAPAPSRSGASAS